MEEYADIVRELMTSFQCFKRVLKGHMHSPQGLKPSEMGLLFHIKMADNNGIKVSDLSSRMHVTSPSVTQLVTGLEEQGLVQRMMDMKDRRAVKVSLTEKGIAVTEQAEHNVMVLLSGLVEHLGMQKSTEFLAMLNDIMDYFSNTKNKGVD